MKPEMIHLYSIVRYWAAYPATLFAYAVEDELVLARLNWVTLGEL